MIELNLGVDESKSIFHRTFSFFKKRIAPTKVVLYESIKETPGWRGSDFNKFSMYDIGVGSTIEDYNAHNAKIHAYLNNKKYDDAIQEMKNQHNSYWNAINNINTKSICFHAYIYSIDGEPYLKRELEDHLETSKHLEKKGLKTEHCIDIVNEIKKKMLMNFDFTLVIDMMEADKLTLLAK